MQISITIEPEVLKEVNKIAMDKYGPKKRSLLIQLAIKDYLMKERSKKA